MARMFLTLVCIAWSGVLYAYDPLSRFLSDLSQLDSKQGRVAHDFVTAMKDRCGLTVTVHGVRTFVKSADFDRLVAVHRRPLVDGDHYTPLLRQTSCDVFLRLGRPVDVVSGYVREVEAEGIVHVLDGLNGNRYELADLPISFRADSIFVRAYLDCGESGSLYQAGRVCRVLAIERTALNSVSLAFADVPR